MIANSTIRTVIAAQDISRAQQWYAEKLDLHPVREEAQGLVYQLGGAEFFLYQTSFAGTAQNTIAEIEVADFDGAMTDLRNHGVVFEEYDFPNFKTVDGVVSLDGVRGAWFKDSEGNTLALSERHH